LDGDGDWREPGAAIGPRGLPDAHVVLGGEAEGVSGGGGELGDAVLLLEAVVALLVHAGAFTLQSNTPPSHDHHLSHDHSTLALPLLAIVLLLL